MKKIVLYGEQFNPIYTAHMLVINEVFHKIKPDVFYFLPSYVAPLKEHNDRLDTHYRIKMVNMVIEQLGFGNICYAELERKGQSYTHDTLKALINQNLYDKFYFIIGSDQYDRLDKWYKIDELKQMIIFIVVNREKNIQEVDESMIFISTPRMDTSSSMTRQRVKDKKTIDILAPRNVSKYIREGGSYEH